MVTRSDNSVQCTLILVQKKVCQPIRAIAQRTVSPITGRKIISHRLTHFPQLPSQVWSQDQEDLINFSLWYIKENLSKSNQEQCSLYTIGMEFGHYSLWTKLEPYEEDSVLLYDIETDQNKFWYFPYFKTIKKLRAKRGNWPNRSKVLPKAATTG